MKPIEPSNSDHKSYLKDCFGTEEVIDAVLHPANQGYSYNLIKLVFISLLN